MSAYLRNETVNHMLDCIRAIDASAAVLNPIACVLGAVASSWLASGHLPLPAFVSPAAVHYAAVPIGGLGGFAIRALCAELSQEMGTPQKWITKVVRRGAVDVNYFTDDRGRNGKWRLTDANDPGKTAAVVLSAGALNPLRRLWLKELEFETRVRRNRGSAPALQQ